MQISSRMFVQEPTSLSSQSSMVGCTQARILETSCLQISKILGVTLISNAGDHGHMGAPSLVRLSHVGPERRGMVQALEASLQATPASGRPCPIFQPQTLSDSGRLKI